MIRCITIGSSLTIQGRLIRLLPDGKAVIDAGQGPVTGHLVKR